MSPLVITIISIALLICGYRYYGAKLAYWWQVNEKNRTPAVDNPDGIDQVPARHWTILFGHHFASIAGAGPIIGPVLAGYYWGWLPVLCWIIIGSIFMGAVHDFSCLMISLRNQGKTIASVAENALDKKAKLLFAIFLWLALVLVVAVFAAVTAKTLVEKPDMVIPAIGLIGVAFIVGHLMYRKGVSQLLATVLGIVSLVGLIFLGEKFPIVISSTRIWVLILMTYAFLASILPVNLLLQPRDYLATFVLYFGLFFGFLGLVVTRPEFTIPAIAHVKSDLGPIWPMMFVIVACGAISGFHSLVASGTTARQIASEKDALRIGYGSMILEAVLAILALIAVSTGLSAIEYGSFIKSGNWILAFGQGFGKLTEPFFGSKLGISIAILMLNTFVLTTLDSATRISRYITEDLFGLNKYLSTALVVGCSLALAMGKWKAIWPVFGASNQLIAALALLVITVWLHGKGKKYKFTQIPAILMLLTSIGALGYEIILFIGQKNYLLSAIAILLLSLAVFMLTEAVRIIRCPKK